MLNAEQTRALFKGMAAVIVAQNLAEERNDDEARQHQTLELHDRD